MDPEHPDEVYCDGTLWKIDLDKKTSYPFSTVWRQHDPSLPGAFRHMAVACICSPRKTARQYGYARIATTPGTIHARGRRVQAAAGFLPVTASADGKRNRSVSGHREGLSRSRVQPKYPWGATVPGSMSTVTASCSRRDRSGVGGHAELFLCRPRLNLWTPNGDGLPPAAHRGGWTARL